MMAMNAQRQFNIATKSRAKKTEKLSSGYRINRAADDAAGLAISEKMRRQIRGLMAGTENAQHGVSWVQIGDGALNEAHDIMHRMSELSIKAQNETNTAQDKAYMEAEFNHLQSELDRISTTTTFNELNIFREHEPTYDQICGNRYWEPDETHTIMAGRNQLIINYRDDADEAQKTITLEVPAGTYTTHELIDELDDAATLLGSPIRMEYNGQGYCNLNLEGGEIIDTVTGDLAYLLWDTYNGGGYGALIGTTTFPNATDRLAIVQGQNDYMKFDIEFFDGSPTKTIEVDLIPASEGAGAVHQWTKEELMQKINDQVDFANTGLVTSHYGDSIMLSSDLGIITGFKGNMFNIENKNPIYTSVFYDNIQKGYVWQDPAFVVGGAVLTTDTRDKEHNRYYIDSTNNTLVLQPNLTTSPVTITIPPKADGYTAAEMVAKLTELFDNSPLKGEVKACLVETKKREDFADKTNPGTSGTNADSPNATKLADGTYVESVGDDKVVFQGIEIRTIKEGPDAIVNIDRAASTAYDTLFTIKNYNVYGTSDAIINNEDKDDVNAYAQSSKKWTTTQTVKIKNNVNDKFKITLKSTSDRASSSASDYNETFTLDILSSGNKDMTASDIVNNINTALKNALDKNNNTVDLSGRLKAVLKDDTNGKKIICIEDNEDGSLNNVNDKSMNWNTTVSLSAAGSNTGYRAIFQEEYKYDVVQTKSGKGTLTLDTKNLTLGGGMTITVNGTPYKYNFNGKTKLSDIVAEMNKATPIKFSSKTVLDNMSARNFTVSGHGKDAVTTLNYYAGASASGKTTTVQGSAGKPVDANRPAQIVMESDLSAKLKNGKLEISAANNNNKITITSNGKTSFPPLEIADGSYTEDELVDALQKACDAYFGDGDGGVSVDVEDHKLVFTSVLPEGYIGDYTSLSIAGKGGSGNTFFDWLNTDTTPAEAASCTSDQVVSDNITLDNTNNQFKFTYEDSTGPHDVVLNLPTGANMTRAKFLDNLQKALSNQKNTDGTTIGVEASLVNNRLVLTTKEKGSAVSISYTTGPTSNTDPNADAIFGGLSNKTPAQVILDKNVKTNPTFKDGNTKTFQFTLNNLPASVDITAWTTAGDLANKLTTAMHNKGYAVTASIVDGQLCLTKDNADGGSIGVSYDSGGSIMEYIYGYEPGNGITVSASGDTLTIKAGKNDTITVSSDTSGGTLASKKATAYLPHDADSGFHSAKFSTVTSNTLDANGVVLTKWNNDLQFTFKQGNKSTNVSITLNGKPTGPNGETSLSDIQAELQQKINAQLGSDAIEVKLENNKLIFVSKKAGSEFQFSGMQSDNKSKIGGGFFHHVMCGYTEKTSQLNDPKDENGDQRADKIYAQGRHDVVMELTSLQNGISDTLILDLTYVPDTDHDGQIEADKEQTVRLELLLDTKPQPLKFTGEELKTMIQEKLNEEIKKLNNPLFHENMIEVDVGRINNPDIVGNKDSVSISFNITRNPDLATLEEGYFYIDGIRGNAAYETFYYTEGELIPAYIVGTKDISDGVVLGKDDNKLVFEVDGVECPVDLTELIENAGGKKISAKDIAEQITAQFRDQNVPAAANITPEGYLRISHQRMGKHVIEKVTGSARDELFYLEHQDKKEYKEKYVKLSAADNDRIELYNPQFSTMMLNINSICISGTKYAEKATNRLKDAITAVSQIRSTFGALQNRLEHAINNNQNKEENMSAAESRIRDTDIATEMVQFSNLGIIQQAGQAVLAQANQSRNMVLALLS